MRECSETEVYPQKVVSCVDWNKLDDAYFLLDRLFLWEIPMFAARRIQQQHALNVDYARVVSRLLDIGL